MAVDSYARNNDVKLAQQRYQAMGEDASELLTSITDNTNAPDVDRFRLAVTGVIAPPVTTTVPGGTVATQPGGAVTTPAPETGGGATLLIVLCLVLLVIGGALAYLLVFRGK